MIFIKYYVKIVRMGKMVFLENFHKHHLNLSLKVLYSLSTNQFLNFACITILLLLFQEFQEFKFYFENYELL
jgi:hypothetical protein